MVDTALTLELPVAPAEVWSVVGGFDSMPAWHPWVVESALEEGGRVRRLKALNGSTMVERMTRFDERQRLYSYSFVGDSGLPVGPDYEATLAVKDKPGGGTIVEWSSSFTPVGAEADSLKAIHGIYKAGFSALRKRFGG